jgi:hypothetical protein
VLALESQQPRLAATAAECGLGLRPERPIEPGMCRPGHIRFPGALELLAGVLPHGLEQPVARVLALEARDHERPVDEPREERAHPGR